MLLIYAWENTCTLCSTLEAENAFISITKSSSICPNVLTIKRTMAIWKGTVEPRSSKGAAHRISTMDQVQVKLLKPPYKIFLVIPTYQMRKLRLRFWIACSTEASLNSKTNAFCYDVWKRKPTLLWQSPLFTPHHTQSLNRMACSNDRIPWNMEDKVNHLFLLPICFSPWALISTVTLT